MSYFGATNHGVTEMSETGSFEGDVIGALPWLALHGGFAAVQCGVSYSGAQRFGNRSGRGVRASNFNFARGTLPTAQTTRRKKVKDETRNVYATG